MENVEYIKIDGVTYARRAAKYAGMKGVQILTDSENRVYYYKVNDGTGIFRVIPAAGGSLFWKDNVLYTDADFTTQTDISWDQFVNDALIKGTFYNSELEAEVGKTSSSHDNEAGINNAHKVDGATPDKNDTPTTSGSVPNSLTSCTFASDYDDLIRISKTLSDYADSIKGFVSDIYSIIDVDLADAWQGENYQMFSEMCHGYQNTLNDLNVLLYAFSSMYKNVADQTEVLHDNVKQIIDYRLGGDVDGN